MKDWGEAKKIVEMRIGRDKASCILTCHDIEKVFDRFNMMNAKMMNMSLASHFKH